MDELDERDFEILEISPYQCLERSNFLECLKVKNDFIKNLNAEFEKASGKFLRSQNEISEKMRIQLLLVKYDERPKRGCLSNAFLSNWQTLGL